MSVDPAIIQDLAEKLPSGEDVIPEDVQKSKWEYAMVFIAKLELCKGTVKEQHDYLVREFPRYFYMIFSKCFWSLCDFILVRYMQVCSIAFPELAYWVSTTCKTRTTFLLVDDLIDRMMDSLARDLTNFGEPTPERFFKPYDMWKLDEADRLMQDMNLKPVDPYKAVSGMHKYYEVCKRLTGGDHDTAMQRVEQRYDGYQQTMTLMTLMNHIHTLEERLARLEAKQ